MSKLLNTIKQLLMSVCVLLYYPAIVVLVIATIIFVPIFAVYTYHSCGSVQEDEVLVEEIDIEKRSKIWVVHSWNCSNKCIDKHGERKFLWYKSKEKIKDFIKWKYYIYANCIEEEYASMLDKYSQANMMVHKVNEPRYYDEIYKEVDFSDRRHKIFYSYGEDDIVELPTGEMNYIDLYAEDCYSTIPQNFRK